MKLRVELEHGDLRCSDFVEWPAVTDANLCAAAAISKTMKALYPQCVAYEVEVFCDVHGWEPARFCDEGCGRVVCEKVSPRLCEGCAGAMPRSMTLDEQDRQRCVSRYGSL